MGVEIIPNSTKFFYQYRNGDSFTDNPSDSTPNLAAEVGEKVKLVQQIDINWSFVGSVNNPVDWEFLGGTTFRFRKATIGSFSDDGFVTDDNLDWDFETGGIVYSTNGDVTNQSQTWMTVVLASVPTPLIGLTSGQSGSTIFRGLTDLTALIYKFGLIENQETFNTLSKVTQNDQSYYCSGMTEGGALVPFIEQGLYKDWQTGSGSCQRLTNPSTYVQRFEIIHEFIVSPYYVDGELSNLQNNVLPSLFDNNQSLKYAYSTDFRLTLSYTGSSKFAVVDDILGSVGWFNQNFNGFANDYTITSVDYKDDLGASADGILIDGNSVVTVTIAKGSGALVSTDKVGAVISYLAESTDYQDKTTDLVTNFMYDNNFCLADGTPVVGSGLITETSAVISGGDIVLTIKITYSTAQQTILSGKTDPNFLLAISIGDITITNGNSDRVMLIADAEIYETNPDIPDLMNLVDFRAFPHDRVIGANIGNTTMTAWNEDGIAYTFEFTVDTNKSAFVNTIELVLIASNSNTGEFFDMDARFFIDISGAVVSGGVQQLEFTGTRGYTLASGSQFNDVTLTTGANVGGIVTYTGTFALKVNWKDWVPNPDADPIFYDNTKLNDNLNFKSSNYSNISSYQIRCAIISNVTGVSTLGITGTTDYAMLSGRITTFDYDEDGLATPVWNGTIKTFTEDGLTDLGGAIQTDGSNTLVEITYVNSVAPVVAIPNYWGIYRLEVSLQQGNDISELSTIYLPPAGQLPIPKSGFVVLDMIVDSGNIVQTGLIDGSLVQGATSYNISGRLQSPNKSASVDLINFITDSTTPDTFDPVIAKSGTTATWNYGDGSPLDVTNTPSKVYAIGKGKIGYIQVDLFANVSGLTFISDDLIATLDIIDLTFITTVDLEDNPLLPGVINPVNSQTFIKYSIKDCIKITTLDVSTLTGLSGIFNISGCSLLTTLILPTSIGTFSLFDCNTSDLDYFDLTTLSFLTESTGFTIDLSDNSLTVDEVNHFLVDLDTISTVSFLGRTILIDGTNAAPDGSSGGFDGLAAKASLIVKLFTVTTN